MKRFYLPGLLLFFSLFIHTAFAQTEPCITMEMDSLLRAKHPGMGSLDDFERVLQAKMQERKLLQQSGRVTLETLTIPVIVHIVHNGEAVGQGRNLSLARIQSQIATLNEDFRRAPGTPGFNNDPRGADIEIDFCLARIDQQGRPMAEAGVNRINGGQPSWSRNDIENILKPSTIWDPDKYYNIWVLDFASTDGLLIGYAQFPSLSTLNGIPDNSPRNTDGVVVRYQSFGNVLKGNFGNMDAPYNRGRTLTHETGHWLGLRHIWGDANCGNDFVDDTPPQASESRGCSVGRTSCGSVNMVENYMDYSDDACMNIFTNGQKLRMRTVMDLSPRRNTLAQSNLCGTLVAGPPRANFRAETQQILLGGQVRFFDLSTNFPNRWYWTFEGGTPTNSTDQNPVVTYNTPGRFEVTLVAANSTGISDTLKRTAYIEVLNVGLCAEKTNFEGTRTVIRDTSRVGYVSGHNGRRIAAVSESFDNPLGYTNLGGATLRFARAFAQEGAESEAIVRVTVWNARGFQGGPGAILEEKEVPLRTILNDIARNRATDVTFERQVPLSGLPFHVGIQLEYTGDSVALTTTRDGEALRGTSWELSAEGEWDLMLRRTGLNIAHDITARVGMKPSVLISTSAQFINPGESVTLQARGASIYTWSPATGLNTALGPQVIARPSQAITYSVKGTGVDVCTDSTSATIYVRNVQVLGNEPSLETLLENTTSISPNPSQGLVELRMSNALRGKTTVTILTLNGQELSSGSFVKEEDSVRYPVDIRQVPAGIYFIKVSLEDQTIQKRILKY
ncbi:M43 family zinc metalloprotease [Arundinibacter roseus]|uniref:T9SS type A sorting domain-containing protein n=1 Tax=Arundinibacter roseus TaxID=2070510 RepID=A0A4R4K253_9BACT|nr:M43 family zinc metalloprotease [Arundinibacter roseus]TDB61387.1 T9SS type A sorting domain-containing protein [Arundinibacter roseus]